MARLTSGSSSPIHTGSADGDGLVHVRTTVYRVRSPADSHLFTDSLLVYTAKTIWARLTTPRALAIYRDIIDRLVDHLARILEAMGWLTLGLCRSFGLVARVAWKVWSLTLRVGRGSRRGMEGAGASAVRGMRAAGSVLSRSAAALMRRSSELVAAGSVLPRWAAALMRRSSELVGHMRWGLFGAARGLGRAAHGLARSMVRLRPGSLPLWRVLSWLGSGAVRLRRGRVWLGWRVARAGRGLVAIVRAIRRPGAVLSIALHRFRRVPVYFALSTILLLGLPIGREIFAGFRLGFASRIASLPRPSMPTLALPRVSAPRVSLPRPTLPALSVPRVSLPEVSLPELALPHLTVRVPAFIAAPVRRLDAVFAGPLLEPGARVLVADLAVSGQADDLGGVLALVVEAELARSPYFGVVRRERALMAQPQGFGSEFGLNEERALALAPRAASAAVITGEVHESERGLDLALVVLDAAGGELYRVNARAVPSELLAALKPAAQDLRRRLGERAIESSLPPRPVLSRSLPALRAYYRARAHLYRGEHRQAIVAASEALRHDSAFAAGYRVQAEAYAGTGQRRRARQVIEKAWQFRNRLSERERLRLAADREALAGRYSAAIRAYDQLFARYRDEVGALKSQAILQEMIGARGGGAGHLQVAHSIDPVDWPPLERIARFLGYRGRLPSRGESPTEART